MLDSYFFIPGDKSKYLQKIDTIDADYIIIDLEDAVSFNNREIALEFVLNIIPRNNHFVRIPFFEKCYSEDQIKSLIRHFEGRVAVPKISECSEVAIIKSFCPAIELNMIVLVENPLCYVNIRDILKCYSKEIHGIAFGSHDFCSITGIKNTFENLKNFKSELSISAKAFNVKYIDGVDLDLLDFSQFKNECINAFDLGYHGKFLIHPKQLEELKNVEFMSDLELQELKIVYNQIKTISEDSIEVYTINGRVYEKPHIIRVKSLMDKLRKFNKI
ncbi:citrate lyase subunit beta/citryl-CoA lyase [Flavobacterium sp. PL11]|jgi:citrate lyase subunit beta/citryl-CoA lyase|uniref:aldolase/citrate lyase family protein n=1 Tax=Flavobacterium sp. PL11 TaxID=3071717 RepID=UPI002E08F225|nr:citrate lyase subunit beta/citryl-CoA lyase [Flavobacterium sp. PL11]